MSFVNAYFLWLLLPLALYAFKSREENLVQRVRWLVLALLLVALARPVLPQEKVTQKVKAHSLIIALDFSASMRANDIKPSRLLASKETIKKFLKSRPKDQVALIGFTSNPLLLSPPTTDHHLLEQALENINPNYILTRGTDLMKLFEKVALFQEREKRVILFSDGGEEQLDERLISFVKNEKIELFAIGMASRVGSSIEKSDGELLKDKEGHFVVSKLNGTLAKLAKESGGASLTFSSVEDTIVGLNRWIEAKDEAKFLTKESRNYFELAFVPMLLALILFFLSSTRFVKKLLPLALLLGLNVEAEELLKVENWGKGEVVIEKSSWSFLDNAKAQEAYRLYEEKQYQESYVSLMQMTHRDFEAELLLAHVYYKLEAYKKARATLTAMRSNELKIKQQLLYELGNCEAKLAYWDRAKAYYVQALQLGEDEDTLHNLAFVLAQKKINSFKVARNSQASSERQKSSKSEGDESKEKSASKKSKSGVGTGEGKSTTKSKSSLAKVVKSDAKNASKRTLSSKAYDLINEGYIREKKPW